MVTDCIRELFDSDDKGFAFFDPLACDEIEDAVNNPNNGKSPEFDSISGDHLKFAGKGLIETLRRLYNQNLLLNTVQEISELAHTFRFFKEGMSAITKNVRQFRKILTKL